MIDRKNDESREVWGNPKSSTPSWHTGAAAESREVVRVNDTAKDPRYIASHPDIRSEVAVPLISQDRVVGVMDLESDRVGYFSDDHVRILALLAPQVASSVENARLYAELAQRERRMEEDLEAARELQRILLPDAEPEIAGLEAAVRLRPAREISGDIYDIFEQRGGQTVIAVGDVSGKGAAAALYGGLMSGLLRTLAPRRPRPADLMRALNDALVARRVEARYVTLGLLLWDAVTRRIVMANAGALPAHDLPWCRDPQNSGGRRAPRPARCARVRGGDFPGGTGRHHRSLLRRNHGSPECGRHGIRPWTPHADRSFALQCFCGRTDSGDLQRAGQVLHRGLRRSECVRDEGEVSRRTIVAQPVVTAVPRPAQPTNPKLRALKFARFGNTEFIALSGIPNHEHNVAPY